MQSACLLSLSESSSLIVNFPLPISYDSGTGAAPHIGLPDQMKQLIEGSLDISASIYANVEAILVCDAVGLAAVPFLLRYAKQKNISILITDAALEYSRLFMEQLVGASEEMTDSAGPISGKSAGISLNVMYTRQEMELCFSKVITVRFGQYHALSGYALDRHYYVRPYVSGYGPGTANWFISWFGVNIFVFGTTSIVMQRMHESASFTDFPDQIHLCLCLGFVRNLKSSSASNGIPETLVPFEDQLNQLAGMCSQMMNTMSPSLSGTAGSPRSVLLSVPPNHIIFDIIFRLQHIAKRSSVSSGIVIYQPYMEQFFRRLPILTEWIMSRDAHPPVTFIHPGLADDFETLESCMKHTSPQIYIVSEIDYALNREYIDALISMTASRRYPISSVIRIREHDASNKQSKADVVLDASLDSNTWQSIIRDVIRPQVLAVPEYMITESMIGTSTVMKWEKEGKLKLKVFPSTQELLANDKRPDIKVFEGVASADIVNGCVHAYISPRLFDDLLLTHEAVTATSLSGNNTKILIKGNLDYVPKHCVAQNQFVVKDVFTYPQSSNTSDMITYFATALARQNLAVKTSDDRRSLYISDSPFGQVLIQFGDQENGQVQATISAEGMEECRIIRHLLVNQTII